MSELETRRAAAAAFDPEIDGPDAAPTAELIQYDDAEPAVPQDAELDPSDADLLAIPPRADDLGVALAARPPRAELPKLTVALAGAALICAGFIGGVLAQKHLGASASSGRGNFAAFGAGRGPANANASGRGGGYFGRGAAGGAGGGITGTVTVVSGDKLYVTAPDGSVYTVTTTGSTAINVTQSGTLSQLKPGQTVVIAGSDDNKGDVTATSITAGAGNSTTSGTTTSGGQ
jgi:hypothetical protein